MRPLLDTIETSGTSSQVSEVLTDNAFSDFELKKLYSNDELQNVLNNLEYYKALSMRTSTALTDFCTDSSWIGRGLKIKICGSDIVLQDGHIISANFCRLRMCPMCQRRNSLRTYSDFMNMQGYLKDYAFLMLTLTVPNVIVSDLSDTINKMNLCSSRLFRMEKLKKAFCGIARCLEVTYNSTTHTFHPHYHCLIAVKKSYFTSRQYIKHEVLRNWWSALWCMREQNLKRVKDSLIENYNLTLGSELQVNIKRADNGAFAEIAKYAVKPLELDMPLNELSDVIVALFGVLHGKRLVQLYGVIKDASRACGVNFDDYDDDDKSECVDSDTLDKKEIYHYYYNYQHKRYVQFDNLE